MMKTLLERFLSLLEMPYVMDASSGDPDYTPNSSIADAKKHAKHKGVIDGVEIYHKQYMRGGLIYGIVDDQIVLEIDYVLDEEYGGVQNTSVWVHPKRRGAKLASKVIWAHTYPIEHRLITDYNLSPAGKALWDSLVQEALQRQLHVLVVGGRRWIEITDDNIHELDSVWNDSDLRVVITQFTD